MPTFNPIFLAFVIILGWNNLLCLQQTLVFSGSARFRSAIRLIVGELRRHTQIPTSRHRSYPQSGRIVNLSNISFATSNI